MKIKIVEDNTMEPSLTDVQKIEESNKASLPQQVIESGDPGLISSTAIKQVLEIEKDLPAYEDEINILVKWAKSQVEGEDTDYTKLKWAVRDLKMRIGTPAFGDPIKNLARFAYLDLEGKRIDKEKRKFV